jgi:futalosine hydrolase
MPAGGAGVLEPLLSGSRRFLLAVASPAEARAVLAGRGGDPGLADRPWALHRLPGAFDLVVTGIGKTNAAGATARTLDPGIHAGVLSAGVAGLLPGPAAAGTRLGTVIAASTCVFADEGLETPGGFQDCAAMGFPLGPFDGVAVPVDAGIRTRLTSIADVTAPIATVSAGAGTDFRAEWTAAVTGAAAEAMEGAAVALVALRLGVPAGEVRVISNTTGDRDRQSWELPRALDRLRAVIGLL